MIGIKSISFQIDIPEDSTIDPEWVWKYLKQMYGSHVFTLQKSLDDRSIVLHYHPPSPISAEKAVEAMNTVEGIEERISAVFLKASGRSKEEKGGGTQLGLF